MSICDDISEFLEVLRKMRIADDTIVNKLNTTIPTESFSKIQDAEANCKDLFLKMVENHSNRERALIQCLTMSSKKLQGLKEQKRSNPNDVQVLKSLRNEQTKYRELLTQVNVEEVIRNRSLKIYHERCRIFYKPDSN